MAKHDRNWFRINKIVYRMPIFDSDINEIKMIKIESKDEADYLFDCQNEIPNLHYWGNNDSIFHNVNNGHIFHCPICGHVHFLDSRWKITYENGLPTVGPKSVDAGGKCHAYIKNGKFGNHWLYGF